jgi:hypothetical protein
MFVSQAEVSASDACLDRSSHLASPESCFLLKRINSSIRIRLLEIFFCEYPGGGKAKIKLLGLCAIGMGGLWRESARSQVDRVKVCR